MSSVLVCRKAPDFGAMAVYGDGEIKKLILSEYIKDHYAVVFFYPLDFTFVCPSELIAFDKKNSEFEKRKVKVIGVSIDSHYTHHAWRNTPVEKGGIGNIRYPLVADITHSIAQSYGVEHPELGVALRGAFIIDRQGIVRAQIVNDLPIGRNIEEILRTIDALQFHEEHGEVCPANWREGKHGMDASTKGVQQYLAAFVNELE